MTQNTQSLLLFSGLFAVTGASDSTAHEAWILTPDEIEALAAAPMPPLFLSQIWLCVAAAVCCVVVAFALHLEKRFGDQFRDIMQPLTQRALNVGPVVLRLSLAAMLGLAAFGGLPRHGVAPWTEPTFLVPDMPLSLVPGWDVLAPMQFALALLLALGFAVRFAGLVLIGFSVLGIALFGSGFLSYTPHFAAPGLVLAITAGGAWSLDRVFKAERILQPGDGFWQPGWRSAQVLIGVGFIYLAVGYKLLQPTLIIAILEHGNVPTFGLPLPVIALVMTGVEITAGALIAMGRLIRPLAVILIGAMTFLAIVLGETPLFHANLYGMMVFFLMAGQKLPQPTVTEINAQQVAA